MIYAVDGGLNQLLMKLALQFFVNSLMENLLVLVKKKNWKREILIQLNSSKYCLFHIIYILII